MSSNITERDRLFFLFRYRFGVVASYGPGYIRSKRSSAVVFQETFSRTLRLFSPLSDSCTITLYTGRAAFRGAVPSSSHAVLLSLMSVD